MICLSAPGRAGGYDAIHAIDVVNSGRAPMDHFATIWGSLFDKAAVANLRALHIEFEPVYVLSTSWTGVLNQSDLWQIILPCGLSFVVESMHKDWTTPRPARSTRAEQIDAWLASHPEVKSWVALDDDHSGDGFDESHGRVVLCEVGKGFVGVELEKARAIIKGYFK